MAAMKIEFNDTGLLPEIWRIIILLLDPKDVARMKQVNKFFKQLADSITVKEYYSGRPNNTPLNLKAFLLNKIQSGLISVDDKLILSLMKFYPSEILKRDLTKDFQNSIANENNYKKAIIKFNDTKNIMHTNDAQDVVSLADRTRNNLISFIQRENKLPKKLRWGTLVTFFLLTVGYLAFFSQANFIKRFPNECDLNFSFPDCQRQVDKFFTQFFIFMFLMPTGVAAMLKSVENALFKKLASKLTSSLILPKLEHSYLSGTFRNYLGKTIDKRDYISLVASLCLLLILKISDMATFDIKNCIVSSDLSSTGFDPECLSSNMTRIDHHYIAPISAPAGFLFAYSVMTLMMLTLTVTKKACAAFKDCYNNHGFLGRNNTGESFALLEARSQANYQSV